MKLFFVYALILSAIAVSAQETCDAETWTSLKELKEKCDSISECKADDDCNKFIAAYKKVEKPDCIEKEGSTDTIKSVFGEAFKKAEESCKVEPPTSKECNADTVKAIKELKEKCNKVEKCEGDDNDCKKFVKTYNDVKDKTCVVEEKKTLEDVYKEDVKKAEEKCKSSGVTKCEEKVIKSLDDANKKCKEDEKCSAEGKPCDAFKKAYKDVKDKTCVVGDGKDTLEKKYKADYEAAEKKCKEEEKSSAIGFSPSGFQMIAAIMIAIAALN